MPRTSSTCIVRLLLLRRQPSGAAQGEGQDKSLAFCVREACFRVEVNVCSMRNTALHCLTW